MLPIVIPATKFGEAESLDKKRFVHSKLFHTIFFSVFYLRILTGLVCLDEVVGAPMAKVVGCQEEVVRRLG